MSRGSLRPWLRALLLFAIALAACGPLTPAQTRGAQLYQANCASCHGGAEGGGMMDYPPRHNANGHTWHHPDCELKETIRTGGGPMVEMMRRMMAPPGAPTMPAFAAKLSDEEIDLVLEHIKSWWTPAQRAAQAEWTQQGCKTGS